MSLHKMKPYTVESEASRVIARAVLGLDFTKRDLEILVHLQWVYLTDKIRRPNRKIGCDRLKYLIGYVYHRFGTGMSFKRNLEAL